MSKIVCDVCGTRYPDTASQCPICGYANVAEVHAEAAEPVQEVVQDSRPKVKGGRFSKANVRKRNQEAGITEKRPEPVKERARKQPEPVREHPKQQAEPVKERPGKKQPEPDWLDENEEEFVQEPRRKSGGFLNVLLVLVILALLAVTAYIAMEYFLPNALDFGPGAEVTEPSETVEPTVTENITEEPTVPCTGLTLDVEEIVLDSEGQAYLLNVVVTPEDTTDLLTYISSDESVATVNDEGRVTAVSDGEAVIYILCGDQSLECTVRCELIEETEEPTEPPTEEPTEEPTKPLKNVKLSVKMADLTLRAHKQESTIIMTCDLKSSEVTWHSENENVATVDENGVITRMGKGTTYVIGTYGDQEIKIIVRCP